MEKVLDESQNEGPIIISAPSANNKKKQEEKETVDKQLETKQQTQTQATSQAKPKEKDEESPEYIERPQPPPMVRNRYVNKKKLNEHK